MRTFIILLCMAAAARAQDLVLWNGEQLLPACTTAYGSTQTGPGAHAGKAYFRAMPDNHHPARLGLNCSGHWRADISGKNELRFFAKADQPGAKLSVRLTTYYAQSKWVDAGAISNAGYQEIRLALDAFRLPAYDLSSVEYIEFALAGVPASISIDDISAADIAAPRMVANALSCNVLQIKISERPDTSGLHDPLRYTLKIDDGPAIHPARVGRHAFVEGLRKDSGAPEVEFEVFLIFNHKIKNGQACRLQMPLLADLSGNKAALDTIFTFTDEKLLGNVKVNQIGFLPDAPKTARLGNFLGDAWGMPVDSISPPVFELRTASHATVFSASCKYLKKDFAFSGEYVFEADFSAWTTSGDYYIYVPGYGRSPVFHIGAAVYNEAAYHTARALYYQRSGALDAAFAGGWARQGLPTEKAVIHSSQTTSLLHAATDFPAGTQVPVPGGWFDAGDYGRYVPTAASALFILFTAWELFPETFSDNAWNLPESGNKIPDILDEIRYETDWLMHMQAPDGGVFFRVTPASWSVGLPAEEQNPLYVSEKTTQSTALFAAAMAMAARNFQKVWPAYAESCLAAAERAWKFLQMHPQASAPVNVPGISAGPYPDPEDRDNRAWAAAELYKTTGKPGYAADFQKWYGQIPHLFHATMSWQQHTFKAAWAYATTTFPKQENWVTEFRNTLTNDLIVNYNDRTSHIHPYHGAYHPYKGYVGYGTFGMAQSYAFDYILFSYLLKKPSLLPMAAMQLDIPLGNNPLGRSFITGLGARPPAHPLHWSTATEDYAEPVPGVPVFGPAASLLMNRPSSVAIQDSANRYPYGYLKDDPYPVLRRYTDAREAVEMSEFTIQELAVTAAVFAFFSDVKATPLPVHFMFFTAKATRCAVALAWRTDDTAEVNYFSVQRSSDARKFTELGRVFRLGSMDHFFAFTDSLPENTNYYRIIEVDFDGDTTASRIQAAAPMCSAFNVKVSSTGRSQFLLSTENEENAGTLQVELVSPSGRIVSRFSTNDRQIPLDASGLAAGVYILRISRSDQLFTTKVIIH